jgi:hypothetical protein
VTRGGDSNHLPILLEITSMGKYLPSPFKFNSIWLEVDRFRELVKFLWNPFDNSWRESTLIHFEENLKKVKQTVIKWAHKKNISDDPIPFKSRSRYGEDV